jgi:hypothetical protein
MIVILAAAVGIAVLTVLLWAFFGWQKKRRRQARLDIAFSRARTVERTGSGLQGTPYSVYGESAWADHTRDGR